MNEIECPVCSELVDFEVVAESDSSGDACKCPSCGVSSPVEDWLW